MAQSLREFIKKEDISSRVEVIGKKIASDYKDTLVVICVLKGAYVFCSDLLRAISRNNGPEIQLEFIRAKSYDGNESIGDVRIDSFECDVNNKHVLVVEDIVDTGLTIRQIREILSKRGAKSTRVCALLDKPSRRKVEAKVEYIGFEVPNLFLVGYGLDYDEKFRDKESISVYE